MKKIELENKILDQNKRIFELEAFEQIGDKKLEDAYKKVDKYLAIINKIKELL